MAPPITQAKSPSPGLKTATPVPQWAARLFDEIPAGVAVFDQELRYLAANALWIDSFKLAALSLAVAISVPSFTIPKSMARALA